MPFAYEDIHNDNCACANFEGMEFETIEIHIRKGLLEMVLAQSVESPSKTETPEFMVQALVEYGIKGSIFDPQAHPLQDASLKGD